MKIMTNTTNLPETESNPVQDSLFLQELVSQVRAQDVYGVYKSWKDELVIANFVVPKEKKKEISLEKGVDPATQLRILYFYRAIAARVEKETGNLCQVALDLSHEGFGWAIVWTGHLIVLSRTLRDAHRFGYPSLKKLATQGEKLVDSGIKTIEKFPETANA
jgi:probable nitrogen fixation protein